MLVHVLLLVVLVLVLVLRADGPVPNQFRAVVEANIVNKEYTIHFHEWYDEPANQARADTYDNNREHGYTSSTYDFKTSHYYHTNKSGCFYGDPDHLSGFNFMARDGGAHVTTSAKLFAFGGDLTETYMGVGYARGIKCDKWTAVSSSTRGNNTFTLDYYFSQPSWNLPEVNRSRVPIRVVLNGSRIVSFNRTTNQPIDPPIPHSYHHVYDYVSFHVGPPDKAVFDQPCGAVCKSNNVSWKAATLAATPCPTSAAAATCDWKAERAIGLSVALFFGGLLVGAVVVGCVLKGKQAQTGKYETQNNING